MMKPDVKVWLPNTPRFCDFLIITIFENGASKRSLVVVFLRCFLLYFRLSSNAPPLIFARRDNLLFSLTTHVFRNHKYRGKQRGISKYFCTSVPFREMNQPPASQ